STSINNNVASKAQRATTVAAGSSISTSSALKAEGLRANGASESAAKVMGQNSDPKMRERIQYTLAKLGPAVVRQSALLALLEAKPEIDEVTKAYRTCPILSARV